MPHTMPHWNLTFIHVQYGKGHEKALGDDIPSLFINGLFDIFGHGHGFSCGCSIRRWFVLVLVLVLVLVMVMGKGGEEPGDGALYRVFSDPAVDFGSGEEDFDVYYP